MHYIVFDALNALLPQRIPQIQCCLSVSAPHDGSVNGVQVVDSLLNLFDMFHTCDRDATGHRAAEHLVTRDGHRVDRPAEGDFGREGPDVARDNLDIDRVPAPCDDASCDSLAVRQWQTL